MALADTTEAMSVVINELCELSVSTALSLSANRIGERLLKWAGELTPNLTDPAGRVPMVFRRGIPSPPGCHSAAIPPKHHLLPISKRICLIGPPKIPLSLTRAEIIHSIFKEQFRAFTSLSRLISS